MLMLKIAQGFSLSAQRDKKANYLLLFVLQARIRTHKAHSVMGSEAILKDENFVGRNTEKDIFPQLLFFE